VLAVELDEPTQVCFWTETISALTLRPAVFSWPQCLSLASGHCSVTALAGDTLKVHAAVVQLGSSNTPTILGAVASFNHHFPVLPVLQLETRSEIQADGSVEAVIAYNAATYNAADWNADMVVCYWVHIFQHFTPGLQPIQSRTPAQCLTERAGTFTVKSPTTGSSQVAAAVVKRDAAVINMSTLLS
jgi:hypothetical protein